MPKASDTTVETIIDEAGGAPRIARASAKTDNPIKVDAVYKWPKKFGIPERHWSLVMSLTNRSLEDIYAANRAVRNGKAKAPKRTRRRSPARRALGALAVA